MVLVSHAATVTYQMLADSDVLRNKTLRPVAQEKDKSETLTELHALLADHTLEPKEITQYVPQTHAVPTK
jgi:hypothetical protein